MHKVYRSISNKSPWKILTGDFQSHSTTEAVVGVGNTTSRPTSPVPNAPADVAIEIDEDPPDAADSEPLVCC